MSSLALRVTNVWKRFGARDALAGVSLEVKKSEKARDPFDHMFQLDPIAQSTLGFGLFVDWLHKFCPEIYEQVVRQGDSVDHGGCGTSE